MKKPIFLFSIIILFILFLGLMPTANSQNSNLSDIAPRGNWDQSESGGDIILDSNSYYRVFQGEEDIENWFHINGDRINGESLHGINDRSEGDIVDLTGVIPRSQTPGRYRSSSGNITATVVSPRINTLYIYNELGVRLQSGSTIQDNQKILISSTWNFPEAEDIEIDLFTPDGVEIERQVLDNDPTSGQISRLPSGFNLDFLSRETQGLGSTGYRTAFWLLDLNELGEIGTYTIRVKGVDDLDFEDTMMDISLNVGSDSTPQISLDEDRITRGERLRYTITGSRSGLYHAITISKNDLRRQNITPSQLFNFAGDTVEVDETDRFIYAILEISNYGDGIGLIDTTYLDTGRISVNLYNGQSSINEARDEIQEDPSGIRDRSFSLEQSNIGVVLGNRYTPGDRITLSGTASPGIRRIALYVMRGSGDWTLLPLNDQNTTSVGGDGRWIARNVIPSEERFGGRLLRLPGNIRIAVVDAADLSTPPQVTINPSMFNRFTTSLRSVRIDQPSLIANLNPPSIAQGDRLTIGGVSIGSDQLVITFIDESGNVVANLERIRSGSRFEVELYTDDLDRGSLTMLVMAPGRDGEFGDGSGLDGERNRVSTSSASNFRDFVQSFDDQGLTKSQIISRISSESSNEVGSDDLLVRRDFRLERPRTEITDIVPSSIQSLRGIQQIEIGEEMLIRGITNRNPIDTSISVEIVEGPSAEGFNTRIINEWNIDTGEWSTRFNTMGIQPGRYIVEVDDGDSTDRVEVAIVRQRLTQKQERELNQLREFLNERNFTIEMLRQNISQTQQQINKLTENNTRLRNRIQTQSDRIENLTNRLQQQNQTGFTVLATVFGVLLSIVVLSLRNKHK